jgi:Tfp pilus assembly protein PilX
MFKHLNQKGQAILIVVLAMVVALTVGLSVVSRSITNLRNSQQEIDSQKALSAAEAGVGQAINNGNIASGIFSTSTSYSATETAVLGSGDFLLNGNNQVSKDDAMYVWLTPYSTNPTKLFQDPDKWNGTLNIYWGDASAPCDSKNAAIEIAVVSGSRALNQYAVTRSAYDPCSSTRTSSNGFTPAAPLDKTIGGIKLYYTAQVNIANGFLVRIEPLYTDTYIGASGTPIAGGNNLPPQGNIITSIGKAGNNIVRTLNVFQGYPEIPAELFPFTIFWP